MKDTLGMIVLAFIMFGVYELVSFEFAVITALTVLVYRIWVEK